MEIKIVYLGRMKSVTGKDDELLQMYPEPDRSASVLKKHLADKYGVVPPYNILINNTSLTGAVKKNIRLKEGDEIRILPYMSGG